MSEVSKTNVNEAARVEHDARLDIRVEKDEGRKED